MKHMFFLLLLITVACNKSTTPPGTYTDEGDGQKYVMGKVTDRHGTPIEGARITVDNTLYYNSAIPGTTDAGGNYKIAVPIGSWRVYANIDRTFNGNEFEELDLHPDKENSFSGAEGTTVNFQWKLEGEKPAPMVGYYGGTVYLYPVESEIWDSENIEFTFTPVGNLIDGYPGTVLKRTGGAPNSPGYSKIVDIPLGRYTISAKHVPTGKVMKLRNSYDASFVTTLEAEFLPEGNFCDRCMTIDFTDK